MKSLAVVIAICFAYPVFAQDAPLVPTSFSWPVVQTDPLLNRLIEGDVGAAQDEAREAITRAAEARRAAAQAKRRAGLQGAFGIKPDRSTSDGETEVHVTRGTSGGDKLGVVKYSTGATFTGSLNAQLGVYTPAPESPLARFSGWVFGATSSTPTPMEGIFEWKNRDTFTGSMTGDGSRSRGTYTEAGGLRQFIGIVDLSQNEFRPVRGYLKDKSGKLLAVVARD